MTARESRFTVALESEEATQRLAVEIANALEPGDVVTLSGDLGAGKTAFARALIRHVAGDPDMAVPSPTFTLMQVYELPRFTLAHADLYRLSSPDELAELGLDEIAATGVVLMEWPDRAGHQLPGDRIDIALTLAPARGDQYRDASITGYGRLAQRVARIEALLTFLHRSGYARAERQRMQGDASTRLYERVVLDGKPAILMNAPRRTDGPPIRDGKPYSAIAHLAEDVRAFVAMADGLRTLGFSAPDIYAADLENGFLLIEDFGADGFVAGSPPAPVASRYKEAAGLLAALHSVEVNALLPLPDGTTYAVPAYDKGAFLIEAELLLDWYIPHRGLAVNDTQRETFRRLWLAALQPALADQQTWVLRDYHSPNLIWLPGREGYRRVGLLDFQDAVIGPTGYDVASLLQDARVDVPESLAQELFAHYVARRSETSATFDPEGFGAIYAVMAAQRATKILGIFARLDRRDGKPQYLRHMPRVWRYLQRALGHPALGELSSWYKDNVPAFDRL